MGRPFLVASQTATLLRAAMVPSKRIGAVAGLVVVQPLAQLHHRDSQHQRTGERYY